MFDAAFWQDLVISLPAILIALSFHEFAHGYVAYRLGDLTPKYQGRLTVNPLAHLDPIGTIMLIFAHFGWAKPVMVNPLKFRGNMQRGMMLVALAGPLTNLFIALIGAILYNLVRYMPIDAFFKYSLDYLVIINLSLAFFNLIPVPPLDGSKILAGLLPYHMKDIVYKLEMYGPIILIMIIVSGVTDKILWPMVVTTYNFLMNITGIFSML